MRRWIDWFFVSVATFLCGSAVVLLISMLSSRPAPQTHEMPLAADVREAPKAEESAPEFHDLPNFGYAERDFYYDVESAELIMMFDDGIYRASEVVAKPGQNWLVLTKNGNNYSLQNSRAAVTQLSSVSWPGDENDAKLGFNVKGNPLFAVRNITGLKPGPVTTIFHENPNDDSEPRISEISDGYNRTFELGDNSYILRVSNGLTKDGTKVAVLVIESGGVTQVIKQVPAAISPDRNIIGSLLWAGDMDGDGKLDLYFDEFNEKGYTATELHLSTPADTGKLVKLTAEFGMAGC